MKYTEKKILNIHGYGGDPRNAACGALSALGCDIVSPAIDYDAQTPDAVMAGLRGAIAEDRDIGVIVGTSLGGFFAAVLAAETGLPVMLVNPALLPFLNLPRLGYNGDVRPFIRLFGAVAELGTDKVNCIVGGKDEVIDTHDFTEKLFGSGRVRIVPEGMHSGATLPLAEYFGEILKKL